MPLLRLLSFTFLCLSVSLLPGCTRIDSMGRPVHNPKKPVKVTGTHVSALPPETR